MKLTPLGEAFAPGSTKSAVQPRTLKPVTTPHPSSGSYLLSGKIGKMAHQLESMTAVVIDKLVASKKQAAKSNSSGDTRNVLGLKIEQVPTGATQEGTGGENKDSKDKHESDNDDFLGKEYKFLRGKICETEEQLAREVL